MKKLFIHIPKNAGTSVLRTLKDIETTHHEPWWRFNIKDYYSFAIVRNPWDRVVSTYEYCIMDESTHHYMNSPYGRYNKDYHLLKRKTFKQCLKHVEWNFVRYIGWQPQHFFICDKNNIKVNKIYRFENLSELEKDFNIKLPHLNMSKHINYKNYYDDKLKNLVYKLYKEDIDLFKYEF